MPLKLLTPDFQAFRHPWIASNTTNHHSQKKYIFFSGATTTTPPTIPPTIPPTTTCEDIKSTKFCKKAKKKGKCSKASIWKKCQSTCEKCDVEEPCEDQKSSKFCNKALTKGKCGKSSIWKKCKKTCDKCPTTTITTTTISTTSKKFYNWFWPIHSKPESLYSFRLIPRHDLANFYFSLRFCRGAFPVWHSPVHFNYSFSPEIAIVDISCCLFIYFASFLTASSLLRRWVGYSATMSFCRSSYTWYCATN